MNPDGPDVSVPLIPLVVHLVQRGHVDAAAQLVTPVIRRLLGDD